MFERKRSRSEERFEIVFDLEKEFTWDELIFWLTEGNHA
jgi:hypothetical protein